MAMNRFVLNERNRKNASLFRSTVMLVVFLGMVISFHTPAHAFYVTSPFGWRTHPITGENKFHSGIDIAADTGDPIPAIWAGQVVYAGWYDGFGNTVILFHGDGVYTLYGHCSQLLVTVGETAEQGTIIALVGSTGISTGPHVHVSLIRDNQYVDPMIIWQGGS